MIFLKKPTKSRVFYSYRSVSGEYIHLHPHAHLFYLCTERVFPKLRATAVRFDHSRHPLDSRERMRRRQNAYNSGFRVPSRYDGMTLEEILTSLGKEEG